MIVKVLQRNENEQVVSHLFETKHYSKYEGLRKEVNLNEGWYDLYALEKKSEPPHVVHINFYSDKKQRYIVAEPGMVYVMNDEGKTIEKY